MAQESVSISQPVALDYDSTLVLAIELSNTSWVLAAQVPGLPRVKAKQTIEPTAEALLTASGFDVTTAGNGRDATARGAELASAEEEACWASPSTSPSR